MIILSGVDAAANDLTEATLADTKGVTNTLASPHRPPVVLTASAKIQRLIDQGDLENLRTYLIAEVDAAQIELLGDE